MSTCRRFGCSCCPWSCCCDPDRGTAPPTDTVPFTWAALKALPEEDQTAHWCGLIDEWRTNAEREADDDLAFDHRGDRFFWE
jgi:hypothetical protein